MKEIYPSLYQFTYMDKQLCLTSHQYLLDGDTPILFATGTKKQALLIIEKIKDILGSRSLKYIFISHLESDECGGLMTVRRAFPKAEIICSPFGECELRAFGVKGIIHGCSPDCVFKAQGMELHFLFYPSEVHMQNGIVAYENVHEIFFSSDLFSKFGEAAGKTIQASWKEEILELDDVSKSDWKLTKQLKIELCRLNPQFVAVGHGFCMDLRKNIRIQWSHN